MNGTEKVAKMQQDSPESAAWDERLQGLIRAGAERIERLRKPVLGFDEILAGVNFRAGIDTLTLVARMPGCRLGDRSAMVLKGSRVDYRRIDDDSLWSVTIQDASRESLAALSDQLLGWGSAQSPDVSSIHICIDAAVKDERIERLDALALLRDFWSSPVAGKWRQVFESTWYFGEFRRGSEPDFQVIAYDKTLDGKRELDEIEKRARFEIRFTQDGLHQAGIGRLKTLDEILAGVNFRAVFGAWFRYRRCLLAKPRVG